MSYIINDQEAATIRSALALWERCKDGHLHTFVPDEAKADTLTEEQRKLLSVRLSASDEYGDEAIRDRAQDLYGTEDNIDVDLDAIVSRGEGGAFVSAWVWVPEEGE
jgi:hypothetical protein